jgi:hypothetical protein
MARVLVAGGRLTALVWQSIDHSPGFEVLADALDRNIVREVDEPALRVSQRRRPRTPG